MFAVVDSGVEPHRPLAQQFRRARRRPRFPTLVVLRGVDPDQPDGEHHAVVTDVDRVTVGLTRSTSHVSSSARGGGSGVVGPAAAPAGVKPVPRSPPQSGSSAPSELWWCGERRSGGGWLDAFLGVGVRRVRRRRGRRRSGQRAGRWRHAHPLPRADGGSGCPAVRANATNTVALCPGYVGGTYAVRRRARAPRREVAAELADRAGLGGLPGALALLLATSERRVPHDRAVPDPARPVCCSTIAGRLRCIGEVASGTAATCRLAVAELGGTFLAGGLRRLLRRRPRDHADRRPRPVLGASPSPSSTPSSSRWRRRSTCRRRRSSCSPARSSGRSSR